jgi:hypothetical protein
MTACSRAACAACAAAVPREHLRAHVSDRQAGQFGQPNAGVLEQRYHRVVAPVLEPPPLHVTRSAASSSSVKTGMSLSPIFGGLRFATGLGRGSSGSSVACHLKNCCSARNWLLA